METNTAIQRFVRELGAERVWGQVRIERVGSGFQLSHAEDRSVARDLLESLQIYDLRKLATFNAAGQFRPLRAAPDLVRGWVLDCRSAEELWRALQELYPGSIPDWYASWRSVARPTSYREFTTRQSGMYRITQLLSNEQAGHVTRACCHRNFCLKRRFWSVEGLAPDEESSKSAIPCLEPCAVFLELARKAARIEQEEKISIQLTRSDLQSLVEAAKLLAESGGGGERVGNVASATNPRRLQILVEKFRTTVEGAPTREQE